MSLRSLLVGVAVVASPLALAIPDASASVTYGSNLSLAPATAVCGVPCTLAHVSIPMATQAPGGPVVAADGVIVRWRVRTGGSAIDTHARLRVLNGNTGSGSSAAELLPAAAGTYSYLTRLPVQAGNRLGINVEDPPIGGVSLIRFVAGIQTHGWNTPPLADGETRAPPSTVTGELTINADVEPDADGDGFGDETQDACLGIPGSNSGCVPPDTAPPDTTITTAPKAKTKKKTATFEFTGSDARAIASFQCSLDGAPFATCTSPHTVKVKKGKHTFQVRAIDQAGNVGVPASDEWKRKRKRHR